MKPKTPKAIRNGHENLCSELKNITLDSGKIGEQARIIEETMYPHFRKEEKYALPPLGLLLSLSEGNWEFDADEAIRMSEMLQSELSDLKQDHENISKAIKKLKVIADKENNLFAKRFVKDMTLHVEIEDQVLYPATILIGDYLKNKRLN